MSAAATVVRVAPVAMVQRRFQTAIMHEEGATRARAFLRQLHPSRAMTAAERLDVYALSYFLRLRDVLKSDHPGLLHALGEEAFDRVAREYLTKHPSISFTLNDLDARLAKFLAGAVRTKEVVRRRDFLAELATLERAVEEVFHERRATPVDVKRLRSLAPERWIRARFTLNPALRLFAFRFPVNRYLQEVHDGKEPRLPRPERPSRASRSPSAWTVVYRGKDLRTWRADLAREQFVILAALGRGRTLGAALKLALAAKGSDPEFVLAKLREWFAEWTREGLFVAIELR